MDGATTLIFLSFTMLVGSVISGLLPLALSLSETKMRLITVLGAGLLIGTSLAVIIPEGIHSLYAVPEANQDHLTMEHDHHNHNHKRSIDLPNLPNDDDTLFFVDKNSKFKTTTSTRHKRYDDKSPIKELDTNLKTKDLINDVNNNKPINLIKEDAVVEEKHSHEEHSSHAESHSGIGVALVLGFVFMLVVDHLGGKYGHSHGGGHQHTLIDAQIRNKVTFSTTLGLVVHAAADGIALGAAAATQKSDVEMIVFLAIMLHKAPAAFGLVSFLMHEGLERVRIRQHLMTFALSAPIMAILTFIFLKSSIVTLPTEATGYCMLFSAGTFLYVSTVHVLPEIQSHNENRQFNLSEMLSFIMGSILPIFLSIGHHH